VVQTTFSTLSHFFAAYGYWVIFFGVMLENAGVPLPGETVLLFAGFLAYHGHLKLVPAIAVGIAGATLGDTAGYWIGHFGGRPFVNKLLRRFRPVARSFDRSEELFLKHGQWAVFTGRFITGLRVFAGILAGLFRMPYRRFLWFNFTGATAWALAITSLGFMFGNQWNRIVEFVKRFDQLTLIAIALALFLAAAVWGVRRLRGSDRPQERR
jgi:membrane protein DedA with SNARE-associated domain